MTIKEFADLCACNAQTLRYYDRIGLLRPHQVDPWSRYRYYDASQALDFIKIKNLQLADFSIEEIKNLLPKSDEEILGLVRKRFENNLLKTNRAPADITLKVGETMVQGAERALEKIQAVTHYQLEGDIQLGLNEEDDEQPDDIETVWKYHGWRHIYDFVNLIPPLEDGPEYRMIFALPPNHYTDVPLSLAIFMMGALLKKTVNAAGLKAALSRPAKMEKIISLCNKKIITKKDAGPIGRRLLDTDKYNRLRSFPCPANLF